MEEKEGCYETLDCSQTAEPAEPPEPPEPPEPMFFGQKSKIKKYVKNEICLCRGGPRTPAEVGEIF